jgi:hypothetical protein
MELYHTQAIQNQQIQELQYALADANQVQNLNNITVEEFSPVNPEGNYGILFIFLFYYLSLSSLAFLDYDLHNFV